MKEFQGTGGVVYHEFKCKACGKPAKNTYGEPYRTDMRERQLCWECNFWVDFEAKRFNKRFSMTIIGGHDYSPGNRTTGTFRGMAGRRFDIEYVAPSVYAGKKITTFDLWSGSTIPESLREKFPDTAIFLGGAQKCELQGAIRTCWDQSTTRVEPYPLPHDIGISEEA